MDPKGDYSFMVALPSCDGVCHYGMKTLRTTLALSLVLDVFFNYTMTYIHIIYAHVYDLFYDMDPPCTFSWPRYCILLHVLAVYFVGGHGLSSIVLRTGMPTLGMIYIYN